MAHPKIGERTPNAPLAVALCAALREHLNLEWVEEVDGGIRIRSASIQGTAKP